MERVIYKHVYNHLINNNLLYEYQSGFLPKRSTVHQLIEIYNTVLNSLEKRETCCFVFCDFSKAFDRVWHKGLLHKLNAYGIVGNLYNWFRNYLSDRKQKVICKSSASSLLEVSAGVPQGSVLGPLLFLIYINDIGENLESLTQMFADDTSLNYSNDNPREIQNVINRDLEAMNKWSQQWLMQFNPDKTEIMVFSNIDKENELTFSLNDQIIPVKQNHKHLGITLSDDAKWTSHINDMIKNITKHLNMLRKVKYRLSGYNIFKLYTVFIRPLFEYSCEVWDNCGVVNSNRLEKLQLEAARIITGLPTFTSSDHLYRESGLEPLSIRRQRRKLQLFYNIQSGNAPNYLKNLLPPTIQSTTNYPLRNGSDLIVPFCRLSLTAESFIPSTVREWNKLDRTTREQRSSFKFKTELLRQVPSNNKPKPSYYLYGPRKLNIILTQLRCSASFLNADLFKVNIISNPQCRCGAVSEDVYHYFMKCPIYTDIRAILLQNLSELNLLIEINVNILINGDDSLTNETNIAIFDEVLNYIKKSKRFLVS